MISEECLGREHLPDESPFTNPGLKQTAVLGAALV
jgi:hypothetical protein